MKQYNYTKPRQSIRERKCIINIGLTIIRFSRSSCVSLTFVFQCQNEIDDVIGSGRNPVYADKDNMPFVTATLQEVMRYRPVVPLGLARENEEETILGGYRIPKRSSRSTFKYMV